MALSPEAREARRRNLVDSAHALVRETGGTGFSMLELARRAGVSPATPYNLLGSKSQVLRRVIRDEFESFAGRLSRQPPLPPFAHLLRAIDLVAVHYLDEPAFYRGLYHAVLDTNAGELRAMMTVEGQALWRAMIEAAAADGALDLLVDAPTLTALLLRTMGGTVEAWLAEDWDGARFAAEMAVSTRLLLLGLTHGEAAKQLRAEIAEAAARAEPNLP
ncbi:MAG: TetR/AcrR family transcriptional regulator [Sphingomonadales bacterium]|nr:TetR/AcrR family transcriptional regulator [Sphingomonadales bacterium]MDE2568189.1 TetR/AcrR family transcriptional regulator [Sphingomonadales bacterium]